jgi:small subunit ribosomal protein S2
MPYVNERWLGGMLTNFQTVYKRLQRLKELEQIDFDDVAGSGMTKKELLVLRREKDKLVRTLGGIREMSKVPSAVWVVDTNKEHIAVGEARKLGIPVIAILDSNCDPDVVDFPIPGNDDAIRAVGLLTRVIADAVAEGLVARASGGTAEAVEPLAEWEAELLAAHQAEAVADVVAVEAVAEAVVAEAVAQDAVAEAVVAEAVAEDAVMEAVVAAAVAEEEITEAAAGELPVEVADEALAVAVADEVVAEAAIAEAEAAVAVAEEAVVEAAVADSVAEEAVAEAVVAEAVAIDAEAEAAEKAAE